MQKSSKPFAKSLGDRSIKLSLIAVKYISSDSSYFSIVFLKPLFFGEYLQATLLSDNKLLNFKQLLKLKTSHYRRRLQLPRRNRSLDQLRINKTNSQHFTFSYINFFLISSAPGFQCKAFKYQKSKSTLNLRHLLDCSNNIAMMKNTNLISIAIPFFWLQLRNVRRTDF